MALFHKMVRMAVPLPKIQKGDRFLFIAPHPDDIEVGAAETVFKLTQSGKNVKFLICTDGRYGIDDPLLNDEEKIAIRKKESMASAAFLGVKEIEFLQFSDGGNYTVEELTTEILNVVSAYKPDFIFAPDPAVKSELHSDHVKCGTAAGWAFLRSGIEGQMTVLNLKKCEIKGIAYYFTDRPNSFVGTANCSAAHFQSILFHKSQFPCVTAREKAQFKGMKTYLNMRAIRYGLRSFKSRADGFRVLGKINAHCAPESDRL